MEGDVEMLDVSAGHIASFDKKAADANIIKTWRNLMSSRALTTEHFKSYWRDTVPLIAIFQPNYVGTDEEKNLFLFKYLEEFIFNGNPDEILPKLSKLDNPPSVCGRVFKMGEPTYSCRECGMDPTCVLCVDCFKHSAHRTHRYKMGTSNGGGCCDCGDKEAWRREPFCDIHITGAMAGASKVSRLPLDILARMRITLEAVLWYCYNLLTLEHVPSLPSDLAPSWPRNVDSMALYENPDTYCTVLYNDETHTFEQVIHTLIKIIQCPQKDAIEYVTNIDREGRAVVKCATFKYCDKLKTDIEVYTAKHATVPLKVVVMHFDVISHQIHALKMLAWLQGFLGQLEGLRLIFSEVALKERPDGSSIVEGILQRDFYLWKVARSSWHRLFISGMLLEYESKKALATVFTKNYGSVMKDFIRDDHDASFSISSLSVQLFTVPTLAHYLIAEQDVFFILMNTFLSECSDKCNEEGKLLFSKSRQNNQSNYNQAEFKRAQYILYDLRYLLSAKPDVWTENLRRGFLIGVGQILQLFFCMQGMDAVVRQVGHHVDYEPEWESAFNLHIKLAHIITLLLEWCSTDMTVLINAYRCTLKKFIMYMDKDVFTQVHEVADHSATCITYDVSCEPVSVHLPLSRFLAGLHLNLEKFNLSFYSERLTGTMSPVPPEYLIEPVLRTQALIAQVNAGMWRRNGYSLLNQVFFYHNVKCRSEMLDKDIVLLQIGATLIESNEFLIHVLHKFNLLNWIDPSFEKKSLTRNPEDDSMRQTINLVEEFLGLLITVIGERYVPGVSNCTHGDRIKKEIIQQLCIKSMPHSELNKTLPDDIHHETGLENVINEVANFKKPTNNGGKGIYELKPEFYDEYNVFFYHYTREEFSLSEETQRSRRKTAGLLECCPPPKLLKLKDSFSILSNLLQCDVMLFIMQTVLSRCLDLRARSFSETQLHKIVHLIGYALQEEESKNYSFFSFTTRAQKWNIFSLLEQLVNSPRVEIHKDLLVWAVTKYKEMVAEPNNSQKPSSKTDTSAVEPAVSSKEWRTKMAAQQRAKIMAQMASLQTTFMKKNADVFAAETEDMSSNQTTVDTYIEPDNESSKDLKEPVCLGPNQTSRVTEQQIHTCILCQEDSAISIDERPLVLSAFVQQSSVLYQHRGLDSSMVFKENPFFLSASLGLAVHTSTCGHVMHDSCWKNQMRSINQSEARRPYRLRQLSSFNVERKEYLCPLCECLTNTVMPVLPPLFNILPNNYRVSNLTFEGFLECINKALALGNTPLEKISGIIHIKDLEDKTDQIDDVDEEPDYGKAPEIELVTSSLPEDIGSAFKQLFPEFTEISFAREINEAVGLFNKASLVKIEGPPPKFIEPMMCFRTCAYTILALEILLRDSNKSLLGDLSSRQRDCIRNLIRLCGVSPSVYGLSGQYPLMFLRLLFEPQCSSTSILEWDTFGILVSLTFSMPSLFSDQKQVAIPCGGTLDYFILNLLFLCNIVKIIITIDIDEVNMDTDNSETNNTPFVEYVMRIKSICKLSVNINRNNLEENIKQASLPFLRCCALFYHFLTDVPAPKTLTVGLGTYEELCAYLGLEKDFNKLINNAYSSHLSVIWCDADIVRGRLENRKSLVIQPIAIPKLVTLPNDYSELINAVSLFTCPNSERDDTRNPTMCLVCGLMLCSQSYCCQTELDKLSVGACTHHTHTCGAGAGVFLRVRECEVLFLSSYCRGCFVSPPYLDEYGEADQGLRRGNPLTLCPIKFKKLEHIWLSHGIHEVISRAIETNTNLAIVATQWQHL